MSESIKNEYNVSTKPAIKSVTIRSVLLAAGAVILEHIATSTPMLALVIMSVVPNWLRNFLSIELIQGALETILYAIAGYAGINIVKERIAKGDISGLLKLKK